MCKSVLMTYLFQYVDLFPYILFIGAVFFITGISAPVKTKVVSITCMMLLFTCIRYDIGWDYQGYKETAMGMDAQEYERVEFFDKVLFDIAIFFKEYQLFFILASFLTYIPLAWFCLKQSRDPVLSLLVYLLYPSLFLESMSAVRNFMAYSIILIAIAMLIRNKPWKALFWIAIASGFHISALLALLLIPVYKIKTGIKFQWVLWISSFLLMIVLREFLSNLQSENILLAAFLKRTAAQQHGGGTYTILVNALCLLSLVSWKKVMALKSENEGLLRLFLFGICIWNVLGFDFVTRSRMSLYFVLPLLLLVPEITAVVKVGAFKSRKLAIVFFFAVFISAFIINIRANLTEKTKISYLPYQVFFLDHVDYDKSDVILDN